MLVVAVALYVFAGTLLKTDAKKPNPAITYAKDGAKLVAIALLVFGMARTGLGTSHYLTIANPGILRTMAEGMQAQERETAGRDVKNYVRKHSDDMMKNAPIMGNAKGTKTIFVWSTPTCPFVRRVYGELTRVMEADKDVRVVIKEFPIHGEVSEVQARWVLSAKLQSNEKAAELHHKLMTNQFWGENMQDPKVMTIVNKNLRQYAKEVGLDVEKLEAELNNAAVNQELAQVRELAQRFQISGTPYLIIGDQSFPGAVPFQQIMNALK